MKRKSIITILVASAMLLVGCDNKQTPPPNISLEEFKTAINEGILGTQTYSANIYTKYPSQSQELISFNMYSVNDDAIFEDKDPYFYNGYIRQKNQGIVDFEMLQSGSAVIPGEIYAADSTMKIHDFYPAAPSNVFANLDSYTKVKNNVFQSDDIDAMAVIANLGMGIYAMRISNPEYFTVTVSKDYSKVTVKATFIDNYQSEEPGALPDTFVQEPVDITVTFTNIGTTSFPSIEEYVANPDYIFPTPTGWSESDLAILKNHFNDEVPPFVEGLSYAYELKSKGAGNTYYALLVDYASGDLSTSYGSVLSGLDFEPVNSMTYQKVVEDELARHTYEIAMTFYDPDDVMDEQTGEKWGNWYPNGVFQIKFSYKESMLAEVNSVLDLVSYLENVDAGRFFMFDEVNSATKVTKFSDGTVVANQGEGGDLYHFVAPTGYATFKIHFSYEDAVTFMAAEEEYLESCSELTKSTNTLAHTEMYGSEDTITVFQFTMVSSYNESNYPGFVEIRVRIAHNFYDAHKNDPRPDKVRINYQVLNQNGVDVTSLAINSSSKLPLKAEKNTLVNLSTVLNNGYTFVRYEPAEPEESEKTVAAQVEAGTFVVTNAISSFTSPNYDFTIVIHVNELDPSIARLESISVVDLTTNYLIGQTYNFDGRVMAHYSNEDDVDVTDRAIISGDTVNTGVEGRYDIVITFTDDNGQTASKTVAIYVRPNPTYRINVKPVDGITVQITMPSSGQAEKDTQVRFKISSGQDLMEEVAVLTLSGSTVPVDYLIMGNQYKFDMPEEDVVIVPVKKNSVDTLVGSYSTYIPMTTQGYYNKYILTFNSDGTGTYVRDWHNSSPTQYTLNFTYTISGTNITVKLVGFENGASNSSFQSGYRLFVSSQVADEENPEFENLNPTGVRNSNYKITFSLVDSNGDIANTIGFYRE